MRVGVAGGRDAVAEGLQLRRGGGGGARAAVAVQDEDPRLVARQLGDGGSRRLRRGGDLLLRRLDRGGLRLALHRVRERLREQEDGRDDEQHELDRGDEARDERRRPPGADQRVGCIEWRVHSATRFATARRAPASTPRSARGRRRATSRPTSRARARSAASRAPSAARRRAGRPRAAARRRCRRRVRTRRAAARSSCPGRCRRCTGRRRDRPWRAARRRRRRRRRSRALCRPSPKIDRLVAARHALEEDRDDAALEARVLARAVDVREAERDVRRAVDPVPAGEVLLAALLGDPVRRQRQERRLLVGGPGALAVARAARRGEDHLRAAGGLEHVHRADDVDRRVVARGAASTSGRRPARRGGRRRRPRPRTARGCRARAASRRRSRSRACRWRSCRRSSRRRRARRARRRDSSR